MSGAVYDNENAPVYKNGVWTIFDARGRRMGTYTLTPTCVWYNNSTYESCYYAVARTTRNIYFGGKVVAEAAEEEEEAGKPHKID